MVKANILNFSVIISFFSKLLFYNHYWSAFEWNKRLKKNKEKKSLLNKYKIIKVFSKGCQIKISLVGLVHAAWNSMFPNVI